MQESQNYRDTVRQHVDLETIRRRLNGGSYAATTVSLHRDLLLVFTNAVVFFPPHSLHSIAAHQLRALLLDHIKKQPHKKPDSSPQPPSCPFPHPKSAPLVVCRKRTRPSSAALGPSGDGDRTTAGAVSGGRSWRRRGKSGVVGTSGGRTSKVEKQTKKREASSEKKRSATDFLKRIKNKSPRSNSVSSIKGKETGKGWRRKQEVISPSKRAAGDQPTAASGKRGKEERQPRKRPRRCLKPKAY